MWFRLGTGRAMVWTCQWLFKFNKRLGMWWSEQRSALQAYVSPIDLLNHCRTENLTDYIQKLVPIWRGMSLSVMGKTSWWCVGKQSVWIVRYMRDSWTWCVEKLQDVIVTDVVHTAIAVLCGVKKSCIFCIVAIATVKSASWSIKSSVQLPSLPIDVKEHLKEMSEKQKKYTFT